MRVADINGDTKGITGFIIGRAFATRWLDPSLQ
jgi:hypothetical protein